MLFFASILTVGLLCVTGTSQLRLSNSGYEIISINDHEAYSSKSARNGTRSNEIFNLEKAENPVDEEDIFQNKRLYDSHLKIMDSGKNLSTSRNLYLAFRIPTKFAHASQGKDETTNESGKLENNRRSIGFGAKISSMFSPIYPSGFDLLSTNNPTKNFGGVGETLEEHLMRHQVDSERGKSKILVGRVNEISPETREFFKGHQKEKIGSKFPALMVLRNGMKRDMLRGANGTGGILTFPGPHSVGFNEQSRVLRPMELNAVPVISNHIEHSDVLPVDVETIRRFNDFDRRDSNVKTNVMDLVAKPSGSKAQESLKHFAEKIGKEISERNVQSETGMVISIVHDISPGESGGMMIVSKDEANKQSDNNHSQEQVPGTFMSSYHGIKHYPAFYEFLEKLSNTVIINALKYEGSLQSRENYGKKNKSIDRGISMPGLSA